MSSDGFAYCVCGVWLVAGVLLVVTMYSAPLKGRPNRWLVLATAVVMITGCVLTLLFLSAIERGIP